MVIQTTKQCACRWLLQHQHRLKKALASAYIRQCHLQVKEAPFGVEEASHTPQNTSSHFNYDSEYTFKYNDLVTTLAEPSQLRAKPDVTGLKFGHIFTDHMLKIFYHKALGGWQKPEVIPFENISLHPAAKVLHYAVELFEGMKAYRGVDGRIRVFRPDLNMLRMNASARGSGLPTFEGRELIKCINRLIEVDQEWVPHCEASSLYIRPTLIGIDGTLGVSQSDSALLYTILCPVGSYFADGAESISLLADPRKGARYYIAIKNSLPTIRYTRAWPGGCGDRKMGSNYGPTIRVQKKAAGKGLQQVLWLYGDDHQITEVGTMNIFVLYYNDKGEKCLATPPLNGLILPGVTRQSIIELVRDWNEIEVIERTLTMTDIINKQKENRLLEMFGSGTACIVSPIDSIEYVGTEIKIPTMEHKDPLFRRIRKRLSEIQYGHVEIHPWAPIVTE